MYIHVYVCTWLLCSALSLLSIPCNHSKGDAKKNHECALTLQASKLPSERHLVESNPSQYNAKVPPILTNSNEFHNQYSNSIPSTSNLPLNKTKLPKVPLSSSTPNLPPKAKSPSCPVKPGRATAELKPCNASLTVERSPSSATNTKNKRNYGPTSNTCPHCGKVYSFKSSLSKHLKKEHSTEFNSGARSYVVCNQCESR